MDSGMRQLKHDCRTRRSALNCRPAPPATRAAAALPLGRARAAHAQVSPSSRADAKLRAATTWQELDQHPLQVPGAAR